MITKQALMITRVRKEEIRLNCIVIKQKFVWISRGALRLLPRVVVTNMNIKPKKKIKTRRIIFHFFNKNIVLVFHPNWVPYTWHFHRNENTMYMKLWMII